jgi:hypothetical protein
MPNPAVGAFGAGSRRGLVPARGPRRVGPANYRCSRPQGARPMAGVASRRVGGRRRQARPGRLNSSRSPAIALSLASFAKRQQPARKSSYPTRPPVRSASIAGVAWFRPVAAGGWGRRTIVAADPKDRGRWPGWRPGGAMAVGDRPAWGG